MVTFFSVTLDELIGYYGKYAQAGPESPHYENPSCGPSTARSLRACRRFGARYHGRRYSGSGVAVLARSVRLEVRGPRTAEVKAPAFSVGRRAGENSFNVLSPAVV